MEYAHNNNLVHGQVALKNVLVCKDGDTPIYKLTNFAPKTTMKLVQQAESQFWPFAIDRKRQNLGD